MDLVDAPFTEYEIVSGGLVHADAPFTEYEIVSGGLVHLSIFYLICIELVALCLCNQFLA